MGAFPEATEFAPRIASCIVATVVTLVWGGGSFTSRLVTSMVGCVLIFIGGSVTAKSLAEKISTHAEDGVYALRETWNWLINPWW